MTAAPLDALPIFQRSSWSPPDPVGGRPWRSMADRATRRVDLEVALREGRNDVGLVNLGPAAGPVGRLDERLVSVQVSPWTVTRSP